MKRETFLAILVCLSAAALGCATSVVDARLSDDASYYWLGVSPTSEKSIFAPTDEKVTLTVRFANNLVGGQRSFVVRWIGPDGKVFREDPTKTSFGSNDVLIASLPVARNLASRMPGLWSVELSYEDEVLVTRRFEIVAATE